MRPTDLRSSELLTQSSPCLRSGAAKPVASAKPTVDGRERSCTTPLVTPATEPSEDGHSGSPPIWDILNLITIYRVSSVSRRAHIQSEGQLL
eukprot:4859830-Prymnesium_polylepis.1